MVKARKSGPAMAMISATRPYAVTALPPIAPSPAVSMGMNAAASIPPIPANRVAREVYWFRVFASELSAGTIPQKEISCMV